jgi:hypothetical protein
MRSEPITGLMNIESFIVQHLREEPSIGELKKRGSLLSLLSTNPAADASWSMGTKELTRLIAIYSEELHGLGDPRFAIANVSGTILNTIYELASRKLSKEQEATLKQKMDARESEKLSAFLDELIARSATPHLVTQNRFS